MATSTRTVSVGKVGFVWKGVYSATTAYTVWDTFLYNNSVYLCIADASAGTSPDNTSYFTCVSYGLVGKGEYNSANTYDINSIVTNNNVAYIAKEGGITGVWDSTKWMPIPTYIPQSSSVGISYVTTEADNDLVALWNLFNSSSLVVDGTQTTYGMASVNDGSIIMSLTPAAPVMDCPATYNINTSQPYARLPSMNIPGLLMTNGDAITVSVLKWCGSSSGTSGMVYFTPGQSVTETLLADGECGLQIEDLGSYVYISLLKRTGNSISYYLLLNTNSNSNYFRVNSLNDITITLERTASGYDTNLFINGSLIKSQTAAYNYDIDCGKVYFGVLTSSTQYSSFQDRGLAQVAVYTGKKYSANYTADCLLLKKTVI